ncbi:MAG: HAMP domain-containing histidine kinase [Clostridia bacterium]|nr:HAMP domain-containing histidine kinase [Clostridia bacterium]
MDRNVQVLDAMKKKEKNKGGIRRRLFACFAAFVILIFVTLWFFQIRMLAYFYEKERFLEMNRIAERISSYISAEDIDGRVEEIARGRQMCIRVFTVENGIARTLADADITNDCMIHHLTPVLLSGLYDSALANNGVYNERMEFKADTLSEDEEGFHLPGIHKRSDSVNAIHVRVIYVDGVEYLLMVDCELTPMDATVRTLQVQFFWIAGIVIGAALILIFILTRIISKPLTEITEKARGLATGNYEPDFSGKGYREVQELADALNYAAAEIGATDRLQKELIANISHDLRTPLTMIRGYSEMMRDIPGENSPENVQAIIDEATRLSELVNDLMDLSKLQAGTQKMTPAIFDLTETVQDTMKRYDQLIRHEGYSIEFCGGEERAVVEADRTMILQVIYNLINNAVNYTGESKRVVVTQTIANGRVRVSVSDDGEGIPPEQINDIWDRYYRVDKVHKRAVMGTGLGLSIVKGVLEAHKASYGVNSALGVGSEFWFELPLCNSAK